MHSLQWLLPELSSAQWLAHTLIFVANIALLVFSKPILQLVDGDRDNDTKVKIFRTLNILVLGLHVLDLVLLSLDKSYENYFINVGLSLMTAYAGLFAYSLCCYLSRKRFEIGRAHV